MELFLLPSPLDKLDIAGSDQLLNNQNSSGYSAIAQDMVQLLTPLYYM